MEDTDDSIVDAFSSFTSLDTLSPPIDIIDLTKESPKSVRSSRSRQRNFEDLCISSSHNIIGCPNHYKRPLSPIVLGNTPNTQTKNRREKRKISHATSSNVDEVLTLDDTIEEDNKTCYTVKSDTREPVPLICPICLEPLSSDLKPIATRCGHLFCSECLQTFIRTSKKCPTCKATVGLKSCTRLYI